MKDLGTIAQSGLLTSADRPLLCEQYGSLRGDRRIWRLKAHLPHEPLEDDTHPPARKPQVDPDSPDVTPPAPVPTQPPIKDPGPLETPVDDPAAPEPDDPDPAPNDPPIEDPGDPSITPPVEEPPDGGNLPRHAAQPTAWIL